MTLVSGNIKFVWTVDGLKKEDVKGHWGRAFTLVLHTFSWLSKTNIAQIWLIDFVFDPRVGFSETADRMDLFPVAPNPSLRKFQIAIYLRRIIRSTPWLILGEGFRGRRFEWIYFRLDQIQEAAASHLGEFLMTISLEWVIRSTFMNWRAPLEEYRRK